MRKIILSMMTSLDGFIEGPNHNINWHVFDEKMSEYMMGFFDTVDTFLYGRKSYELMLTYWPEQSGPFADIMNETRKIVFSKKLDKVEWNSELVKENIPEKMREEKKKPGKDMVLFAGADITATFIKHNLIDEYRLIINPVALGSGTPLFKDLKSSLRLECMNTMTFDCGNVILIYNPIVN